jgi:hypothetical protein
MKKVASFLFVFGLILQVSAQGLIAGMKDSSANFPECGSFQLMKEVNQQQEGFIELSDQFMEQLTRVVKQQKKAKSNLKLYTIPVVFHVVYNNSAENIPDSVILDQLDILNTCFRRQNADTSNTRTQFLSLVGDSRIEFRMADFDPNGNPTNGITRTSTTVTNFGGILPYGPGQNQQIANWVNDSLYYNYFRLASDSLGGKDPWNTNEYLNIWIGDLRILEPQFNNFQELVFFALATPPIDHVNWPDSVLDVVNIYEQGVLLHYVNVGSNNPNSLPAPYQAYNGVVTDGKILVHEVGHYLGLRHIWGDGDCRFDDFIDDTPRSNASSAWSCNFNSNTCTDTINNQDLFNMVENYMDYSSGSCLNSFTLGQIDLMRSVLINYRPFLIDTLTSINDQHLLSAKDLKCYPNPTNGALTVDLSPFSGKLQVSIYNHVGQLMLHKEVLNANLLNLNLEVPAGIYILRVGIAAEQSISTRFVVQ